ncbi:keratin-associated protein 4-3-like [Exaiptasia diaphana]|uniref:Uncharacterized protein n=1 Tax=Exaiptasia diaphana TaxID=2652724 RepID=A0A913XM01_EXADI|nr:keratin-associated protein 4-3-like [Exaiptasia diaphana]
MFYKMAIKLFLAVAVFSFVCVLSSPGQYCTYSYQCPNNQVCCGNKCTKGSSCVGQFCVRELPGYCLPSETCCNLKCVKGPNCLGRQCYIDFECSFKEKCCGRKCVKETTCLGCTCDFDSQCGGPLEKCCLNKCTNSSCVGNHCSSSSDCFSSESCCNNVCAKGPNCLGHQCVTNSDCSWTQKNWDQEKCCVDKCIKSTDSCMDSGYIALIVLSAVGFVVFCTCVVIRKKLQSQRSGQVITQKPYQQFDNEGNRETISQGTFPSVPAPEKMVSQETTA